jgi:murein DD-endopeptidase MepM/ murein hydrolase activator NlpD
MPPGTLVLAASDGEVWSAGWTPRGYSVVLSHGAPWATYYTHLASLVAPR